MTSGKVAYSMAGMACGRERGEQWHLHILPAAERGRGQTGHLAPHATGVPHGIVFMCLSLHTIPPPSLSFAVLFPELANQVALFTYSSHSISIGWWRVRVAFARLSFPIVTLPI